MTRKDSSADTRPDQPETGRFRMQSVSWRLVLPVPVAVILATAAIWFVVPAVMQDNARKDAIRVGQQIAGQFKTIRGYYTRSVIKKVISSESLKPSVNHKKEENGVPLPATFIHDISALLSKKDTTVTLYSEFPFPVRGERKLDAFQSEAWTRLTQEPDSVVSIQETRQGKEVVRVAIADKMVAQGCVNCHNSHTASPKTDWKLGDVRGVLEVSTVIDSQLAAGTSLSNRMIGGTVVIGLILCFITLLGARTVTRPLNSLSAVMKRLASGDTDVDIAAAGRSDELGDMGKAVQVFRDQAVERTRLQSEKEAEQAARHMRQTKIDDLIAEFRSEVTEVLGRVHGNLEDLGDTSSVLASTANETTGQAKNASMASLEASESVQAVATAAEELAASIQEISRQVADTTGIVAQAADTASESDTKVASLAQAARKISEILSLINDIAEQTNLLALNATIEAARAGESGKGFAVVASEVKELANQTSKATEEIAEQIKSIQNETETTVHSIREIAQIMTDVSQNTTTIAASVEEQGSATSEITRNAQQAAAGATTASENIANLRKSADQTSDASIQMQDTSGSASKGMVQVQRVIDGFLERVMAA